jgi:hypothetical protein
MVNGKPSSPWYTLMTDEERSRAIQRAREDIAIWQEIGNQRLVDKKKAKLARLESGQRIVVAHSARDARPENWPIAYPRGMNGGR